MVEEIRQARAASEAAAARKQPPGPPPCDTDEVKALIAEFNTLYFVVNENGRAAIYSPKHDPDQNRRYYERIEFVDLDKLYLNRTVLTGCNERTGQLIYKRVATVWLHHGQRSQHIGGIVFDPSPRKHPANVLNLWQGFAVQPKAGSWQRLREHTSTVICNGNVEHVEYLMDWMADLVQHPERPGEVAVVLRGPEGTGKGILAREGTAWVWTRKQAAEAPPPSGASGGVYNVSLVDQDAAATELRSDRFNSALIMRR